MTDGAGLVPVVAFDGAGVPAALRERNRWICWRLVPAEPKPKKVPIDPRTAHTADPHDPAVWVGFDEAVRRCRQIPGCAGVGFVFVEGDGITGIDLDDCVVGGVLTPQAAEVVRTFNSYAEFSPSGTGVKIFILGRKPTDACRRKGIEGFGEIEIYHKKRYFTLTGRRLEGVPENLQPRQDQLNALCERLWPAAQPASQPRRWRPPAPIDDAKLLEMMFKSQRGTAIRRLWDGDLSAYDGDDSRADLALCSHLAAWTGGDAHRIDRMFRQSALMRDKWERASYRDATVAKALASRGSSAMPTSRNGTHSAPAPAPACPSASPFDNVQEPSTPSIHIDTDEHRVVAETVQSLAADPALYQRGNVLVRVLRSEKKQEGAVTRAPGTPTIEAVPGANLRERMTKFAYFTRFGRGGDIVPAHPPPWLVSAVEVRGEWGGIRPLVAVSDAPVLRPDGSIWQTPGYDPLTGVLYEPQGEFPVIPEHPTADDAWAAAGELLEVVEDFRFEAEEHRAAWLASLLTPLARFAFAGPAPLFLMDANTRGAGKGLLVQTIGEVVLGREMAVSSYAHDSEEMRKKITAIAIAGDRMVLWDNLNGRLGNDAVDRALTSTRWRDRILGRSEQVELPLLSVWYATGNNVQVGADTARRVIHIRLDVLEERPEDRTDFRQPNLLEWVRGNRGRLLAAGITIVSAYCRAGRPPQKLKPYGSFEGWSDLVRSAVVWAGLPDPWLTREKLVIYADAAEDSLSRVVRAWGDYVQDGMGVTIADLMDTLYPAEREKTPQDEYAVAMRSALENLAGTPAGKPPTARQVANKLKHLRRRVCEGRFLDFNPAESDRAGAVWRLHRTSGCDSATLASQNRPLTRENTSV